MRIFINFLNIQLSSIEQTQTVMKFTIQFSIAAFVAFSIFSQQALACTRNSAGSVRRLTAARTTERPTTTTMASSEEKAELTDEVAKQAAAGKKEHQEEGENARWWSPQYVSSQILSNT